MIGVHEYSRARGQEGAQAGGPGSHGGHHRGSRRVRSGTAALPGCGGRGLGSTSCGHARTVCPWVASRSRTPANLRYEPRADILLHGYTHEYTLLNTRYPENTTFTTKRRAPVQAAARVAAVVRRASPGAALGGRSVARAALAAAA